MTTTNLTPIELHNLALDAAREAETEFMNEYGEPFYCGFAWVKLLIDGRKPFAKALVKAGIASKGWDTGYIIWNPAGNGTQSMDVKEAGAQAYARVFQEHGIHAYMQSRAD
jgi:hypothetical protein